MVNAIVSAYTRITESGFVGVVRVPFVRVLPLEFVFGTAEELPHAKRVVEFLAEALISPRGERMSKVPAHIRKMAHDREFKVTIRIGRSGLSDAMYEELDAQLKSRKVVKVKMNKGLAEQREDRRSIFEEIAQRVNATLVDARGNVAIYWRS